MIDRLDRSAQGVRSLRQKQHIIPRPYRWSNDAITGAVSTSPEDAMGSCRKSLRHVEYLRVQRRHLAAQCSSKVKRDLHVFPEENAEEQKSCRAAVQHSLSSCRPTPPRRPATNHGTQSLASFTSSNASGKATANPQRRILHGLV